MKRARTTCPCCGGALFQDDIYHDALKCVMCGRWATRNMRYGTIPRDLRARREITGGQP